MRKVILVLAVGLVSSMSIAADTPTAPIPKEGSVS
jgi:hypothetical protein